MDKLTNLLNSKLVLTPEMRAHAEQSYLRDLCPTNPNLRAIPPTPSAFGIDLDGIADFNTLLNVLTKLQSPYPPPERLLCANVQVSMRKVCDKLGNMICSQCKLVSYCSKVKRLKGIMAPCTDFTVMPQECQRLHWRVHKRGDSVVQLFHESHTH